MGLESDFIKYGFLLFPLVVGIFFFSQLGDEKILLIGLSITVINYFILKIEAYYNE